MYIWFTWEPNRADRAYNGPWWWFTNSIDILSKNTQSVLLRIIIIEEESRQGESIDIDSYVVYARIERDLGNPQGAQDLSVAVESRMLPREKSKNGSSSKT